MYLPSIHKFNRITNSQLQNIVYMNMSDVERCLSSNFRSLLQMQNIYGLSRIEVRERPLGSLIEVKYKNGKSHDLEAFYVNKRTEQIRGCAT